MLKRTLMLAALVAASVAPASAMDAVLDAAHTQANFTVTHLSLSRVHGQIPLVSGTATIGANDMPTASTATFDLTKVDSRDDNRDASLKKDYFETDKFPTMTFVEKKITGTPKAFVMTGDLTIHGVTKSIDLKGEIENVATVRGKHHVAYSAHGVIDRRDWGMTFARMLDNALFAGNEVTIDIDTDAGEK